METTKEKILQEALRLFASGGYEGVSVRNIAGVLGITQGALYRHYTGKRAIFESILHRMEENDKRCSEDSGVPAAEYEQDSPAYSGITHEELRNFTLKMFRHWTEDEFAAGFRRMLTLEQYRSPEMSALYQQYFGSGVVKYLTDLFRAGGEADPDAAALRFYAPFYFLLNQYDAAQDKTEVFARLERILS